MVSPAWRTTTRAVRRGAGPAVRQFLPCQGLDLVEDLVHHPSNNSHRGRSADAAIEKSRSVRAAAMACWAGLRASI
jgi:hypothetical protein